MWCTYLIVTVAVLGYHVHGAIIENDRNATSFKTRLLNIIQVKCSKNADQIKYQEALGALDNLQVYWNRPMPPLTKSPEENIKECRENFPAIIERLTEFAEKLEPCLEPKEHFLKQFILDGYRKYSDYLCEHVNVVSVAEIIKTNTRSCILQFRQDSSKNPHIACYDKSEMFGGDAEINVLTKSELCQDFKNVYSCYEELFDKHCPNAPELRGFQLGMMMAALEQCSDE